MRTLSVVLTFVLLICSDTFAADEWKEIGVSNKTQGHGDRVYMAKYSDTLKTIARQHTGSEDNWQAIASYNQLSHADSLSDRMLLIPESLLKDSKPKQQFQIQEFKDTTPAPVSAAEEQKITDGLASVKTVNVDLFSGQVEVLAKVDVKRVAVGNGSIIRAEVLKTGELLVIAQAPGSTSLRLWHKSGKQTDFNIRVSEHDPEWVSLVLTGQIASPGLRLPLRVMLLVITCFDLRLKALQACPIQSGLFLRISGLHPILPRALISWHPTVMQ